MTQKYVEPIRHVSYKANSAFVSWLKATLKPGDAIYSFRRCDGKSQPKVFDHWTSGFPCRADGSRIEIRRIFYINDSFLRNTPYLVVTDNPGREYFLVSEAEAEAFRSLAHVAA